MLRWVVSKFRFQFQFSNSNSNYQGSKKQTNVMPQLKKKKIPIENWREGDLAQLPRVSLWYTRKSKKNGLPTVNGWIVAQIA